MVDLVYVLDAAGKVSIILAAAFALYQLWMLARNRKSELVLQHLEFFCSREYEQAAVDAVNSGFDPEKCSDVVMKMIADYWDYMALAAKRKLINVDLLFDMINYEGVWESMKPWVRRWEERTYPGRFTYFQLMAGEQRQRRLLEEKRAKSA